LFDRKKAEGKTEFLEGLKGIIDDLEVPEDHDGIMHQLQVEDEAG
jgi:hypothetical protein